MDGPLAAVARFILFCQISILDKRARRVNIQQHYHHQNQNQNHSEMERRQGQQKNIILLRG